MIREGSSNDKAVPPSLKDLQLSYEKLRKEIKASESSHEFHLAMWKSAPYAVIAMISAFSLAFFVSPTPTYQMGPVSIPAYSIGPLLGSILVAAVGLYGFIRQRALGSEISRAEIQAEETKMQLERRITKVEAQFQNSRPWNRLCHYEDITFEDTLRQMRPSDFSSGIVPQILEDMKQLDADLVRLLADFDKTVNEEISSIISFIDYGETKLKALDMELGVNSPQPPERRPRQIRALYLIHAGIVKSVLDLVQEPGGRPKVYNIQPGETHFIQLLFGAEDSTNPFPRLLRDPDLKARAMRVEDSRDKALDAFTTIDRIIKVKYEQQQVFRPGI